MRLLWSFFIFFNAALNLLSGQPDPSGDSFSNSIPPSDVAGVEGPESSLSQVEQTSFGLLESFNTEEVELVLSSNESPIQDITAQTVSRVESPDYDEPVDDSHDDAQNLGDVDSPDAGSEEGPSRGPAQDVGNLESPEAYELLEAEDLLNQLLSTLIPEEEHDSLVKLIEYADQFPINRRILLKTKALDEIIAKAE